MQANYVMSLGPLMVAIILWKNSLVFHSLDKVQVTSSVKLGQSYLHLLISQLEVS